MTVTPHPITSTNVDLCSPPAGISTLLTVIFATTFYPCWHIVVIFSGWATVVALISDKVRVLPLPTTLITVLGALSAFAISYRTCTAVERFNEGKRCWCNIALASRTLARTIWIHVPLETPPEGATEEVKEQLRLKAAHEKKTVFSLINRFALSVKDYLRGEKDSYQHVKPFLAYMLGTGAETRRMSESPINDPPEMGSTSVTSAVQSEINLHSPTTGQGNYLTHSSDDQSARQAATCSTALRTVTRLQGADSSMPSTVETPERKDGLSDNIEKAVGSEGPIATASSTSSPAPVPSTQAGLQRQQSLPAKDPPDRTMLRLFPLRLSTKSRTARGELESPADLEARNESFSLNVPLEIIYLLSCYIAEIQRRNIADTPTLNLLLANLNLLSDSLTGLDRILTTPIPPSYKILLWAVIIIFVTLLPFQLWTTFQYWTILATAIVALIFCGFLIAGDSIENPFGYDGNHLNMDHFTQDIRAELGGLTSRSPPSPEYWDSFLDDIDISGRGEALFAQQERMERGEQVVGGVLRKRERKIPHSSPSPPPQIGRALARSTTY